MTKVEVTMYPANATIEGILNNGEAFTYNIDNMTADYYECQCDINNYWDYTDLTIEGATKEEEKQIQEEVLHLLTIKFPNISEECDNCSE